MFQPELPLVRLTSIKLPQRAFFSGFTAAWLHDVGLGWRDAIEITVPRLATTSRRSGMTVRRSDLSDAEGCEAKGLPATSLVRAMADLGRRLELVEAVVALDVALRRRRITTAQLRLWVAEHPGYHGLQGLRHALELTNGRAGSPMETRLRLLLILNGLPNPLLQVDLYDDTGMFLARPDLYFPSRRLAIEYDGATHRYSIDGDNARQNRLLEAGYRLLRFGANAVLRTPAAVVGQVERALR